MKKGEIVSMVMNRFRSLTPDRRLSRRYVLSEVEVAMRTIIEQKINDGTLQLDSIYKHIKCLGLEKVNPISCPMLDLRTSKILMRSKKKLPKVLYSRYGSLVREVTTVDNEKLLKKINSKEYRRLKYAPKGLKEKYHYIIEEGYLWVVDTEIYAVNLQMVTNDDEALTESQECLDYSGSNSQGCKSGWDYELDIADHLIKVVVDIASQAVSVTKQIPIDDNPNMKENEQ